MKKAAAILLALSLSLPLAAAAQDTNGEEPPEPRRYAVEVIVFEYAEDVFVGTEIFPPEQPEAVEEPASPEDGFPGTDDTTGTGQEPVPAFGDLETVSRPDDAGDLIDDENADDATTDIPLSKLDALLLPGDALSMDRSFSQVARLDVYRPLLYAGWEQDSQPKEDAEPVPLSFFGPLPDGLDGSFTLYLGRYLHLLVDLGLEAEASPALPDDPAGTGGWWEEVVPSYGDERPDWSGDAAQDLHYGAPPRVVYRILDDRILRNGETRYFDHPKFGVIARITRIEEPEEETALDEPLPLIGGPGE